MGDLIEDYEVEHHPLPETTGVQALKFLTEQHDLKQSDLSEIWRRRGSANVKAPASNGLTITVELLR